MNLAASICGLTLLVAQREPVVFKADANLQTLAVRVTDKQGRDVHGLSAQDFTVFEDGRPQKIAFFESGNQPISLTVVLDSSTSMESSHKLGRARALIGPLIRGNHPDDEISFEPFTDRVAYFPQLTQEQRAKPPAIRVGSNRSGTALYDALATALCHLRTARNVRKAVVVITDGADQHSRLGIAQLIHLARASQAQIFMIGFFDPLENEAYRSGGQTLTLINGHDIDNPIHVFERISKESGAESFFPSSEKNLEAVLNRILGILQAQYTIAYVPPGIDKTRTVHVTVSRTGVNVFARRQVGLESDRDLQAVHFSATSCLVSPREHPFPWEPQLQTKPDGTLLYQEDFKDSRSGWPNHDDSHYVKGAYEMLTPAAHGGSRRLPVQPFWKTEGTLAAYGPWWTDFDASVLVAGNAAAAGLIFRFNEVGCYLVLLSHPLRPSQVSFRLVKKVFATHQETELLPWTPVELLKFSEIKLPTLSVKCTGRHIAISVDGMKVGSFDDESLGDGYVGLAEYGYGRARFQNLRVESLQ